MTSCDIQTTTLRHALQPSHHLAQLIAKVSNDIPQELLQLLGSDVALLQLLKKPQW